MIRRVALAFTLFVVAGPVWAASKEIERLQIQIASLQGQVADLQRVTEDNLREIRRLNEYLAEQNAFLKKGVQDRRMQEEALQVALKEITDRLAEMGEKLQALQGAPTGVPLAGPFPGDPEGLPAAAPPAPFGAPSPAAPAPPPPRELYSQAYADFARGNYDLAVQGFQEYLRSYPSTDFSDNAQYWIGECHYGKQRYSEAVEAWNGLLRDYPASDKLPDARVKKGMALEKLGRRTQALLEYRFVVDRYPNSQAARIAREKLNPQ